MTKKKKIILIGATVALFLILLTGSYLFAKISNSLVPSKPELIPVTSDIFEKTEKQKRPVNVLLLGYGGEGHSGGNLSDVIILISIDKETKKVLITSIPRDLWINDFKINNAYATGGGPLIKSVVSTMIDMPVDDFAGFVEIIDIMGGIEVNVPVTFDDYFYPVKGLENDTCGFSGEEIAKFHEEFSGFELEKQFTCRYEHLHFDQGKNTMDGLTALKFVRSRHSDSYGGDFARSLRQFDVLAAIKNKLISLGVLTNANNIIDKLSESVKTDIDKQLIVELTALKFDPDQYSINTLNLSTDNVLSNSKGPGGQFILVPKAGNANFSQIRAQIKESLF